MLDPGLQAWKDAKWYRSLKVHESWYVLNLIGFSKLRRSYFGFETAQCVTAYQDHHCKLPHDHEEKFQACECRCGAERYKRPSAWSPWRRMVIDKSKRHQMCDDVENNVLRTFTDLHAEDAYHVPSGAKRDRSIQIDGPRLCARCDRDEAKLTEKLHRDHKVPLYRGGKDVAENLQYMCVDCHKFKTAEDEILGELERHTEGWRHSKWEYRLKALRDQNPPGNKYVGYFNDPKTHWEYWYAQRPRKVRSKPPPPILAQVEEDLVIPLTNF